MTLAGRWRALSGSFWSVAEFAVYPALMLLTTPLFLHRLGAELYGQWALLTATVGLGGILSIGTGATTTRHVAHALAVGDSGEAARTLRAGLFIAGAAGLIVAGAVALTLVFGADRFFARMGPANITAMTGLAAAAILLVEQFENVFNASLRGAQRFRTIAQIELAGRTAQFGGAALAVVAAPRLDLVYATLFAAALARLAIKSTVTRHVLGLGWLWPRAAGARAFAGDAGWGWLLGISGMAFGLADRFIISGALGAAALAHYVVANQLAAPLHALPTAAASVLFPRVSAARARGDLAAIRGLIRQGGGLLLAGTTAAALLLFLFREPVLRLWLGSALAPETIPALGWQIWAYWLLALAVLPHFVLLGLGQMRLLALINLAAGLVTAAIMLWTAERWGIAGVAAARLGYGALLLTAMAPLTQFWKRDAKIVPEGRPTAAR
jgi:O-antigen/teichoic acid export membrane protein